MKGRAPRTGYEREEFGQRWARSCLQAADRDGCDQRNQVLARDLTEETFRPGTRDCVVLTGTLADPYSGDTIAFTRGRTTSSEVQIDHVVSLSNAWQTGAQQLDEDTRELLANDPLNLLAVDGGVNGSKGDGDAATWLPPERGYRCAFVARQVAVKARYDLWVTAPEADAISRILSRCPGEPLPASTLP
ncbi:MAG: HNH endonuclease family protein [Pseudonocardia sp.]|nr:HNH endonuclease family protein [Pseudonocardia sp.]